MSLCPCESGKTGDTCCLTVIQNRSATTALALMRSRYTAYVMRNADYLLDTWAPETRPSQLSLDEQQNWLGLKIKRTENGEPMDSEGIVEFVARYKVDGRGHRLHETSMFRKEDGNWLYVSGSIE